MLSKDVERALLKPFHRRNLTSVAKSNMMGKRKRKKKEKYLLMFTDLPRFGLGCNIPLPTLVLEGGSFVVLCGTQSLQQEKQPVGFRFWV